MPQLSRTLLNSSVRASTDEKVYRRPWSAYFSNAWKGSCWAFPNGFEASLFSKVYTPELFSSGAILRLIWSSKAITGNVKVTVSYKSVAAGERFDFVSWPSGDDVSVTTAAPATAGFRTVTDFALNDARVTPGDDICFRVRRNGSDAADTMGEHLILTDARFVYTTAP